MVTLISRAGGFVFGCDSAEDVPSLPTTNEGMAPFTGREEVLPKWSFALVGNGDVYYFNGTAWAKVGASE